MDYDQSRPTTVEQEILEKVFAAVGNRSRLAEHLGITVQAVVQWKRIPPTRAAQVERLTGIPCHVLRPDIFPEPARGAGRG